jgi:hypothetical protein
VRGLDHENGTLAAGYDAIVAEYIDLGLAYLEAHRDEMPGEIANEETAVRGWLTGASSPV